ncbi:MAG: hypothetical protein EBU90_27420, partial [Proteobacteria bacterium]|nr:hypothetical protein [Pseudomonadota bacterium]
PSWGNTDSIYDKPHWSKERQVRFTTTLATGNTVASGNTLYFGTSTDVSNSAIVAGMSVVALNVGTSGEPGFFKSNTTVASVTANTVVLSQNILASVPSGTVLEFDTPISYPAGERSSTYNQDTVLVTGTRLANATFGDATNHATAHQGWVYVTTGTGGRSGRVQTEVLVTLANPTAANTLSGNTSNIQTYYAGV